jgi:hypothetical protein
MVDVLSQIGAVTRKLRTDEVDGEPSHVQTLEQTFPSTIDDVWEAVTTADRIERWFLPVSGELRLVAEGEVTRLHLEHVARAADVPAGMWQEYGPGATGVGWDSALLGLSLHVGGVEGSLSPSEAAAWTATDEGRQFFRGSADGWRAAHEAWGADPQVAARAADATFGAYTGS